MFALDETEIVTLFPAGKNRGVVRLALFVSAMLKVVDVLFRNNQKTPPSVAAVVDAGSVILENA